MYDLSWNRVNKNLYGYLYDLRSVKIEYVFPSQAFVDSPNVIYSLSFVIFNSTYT